MSSESTTPGDTIERCARQSHTGAIDFGTAVARLVALGVESYHTDYRRGEVTYYVTDGPPQSVALASAHLPIAASFDAHAIHEAVRGAQRGEVVYPEFVRRTTAAGCVGYDVWIAGRHVVYHGRRGETLVEPFPGPAPRAPVTVVQQVYEAFGRGDVAAALALFAPEVEIDQSTEVPWGGHYRGHEGARAFFARLTGALRSRLTIERHVDAGDEVVAIGRTRGVTVAGDRSYDVPFAHVWSVRDGLVTRVRFFIDNPTMLASLV